jgi:hypothetical protein
MFLKHNKGEFLWPTVEEIGGVQASQIVMKILNPKERNGYYQFPIELSQYTII